MLQQARDIITLKLRGQNFYWLQYLNSLAYLASSWRVDKSSSVVLWSLAPSEDIRMCTSLNRRMWSLVCFFASSRTLFHLSPSFTPESKKYFSQYKYHTLKHDFAIYFQSPSINCIPAQRTKTFPDVAKCIQQRSAAACRIWAKSLLTVSNLSPIF